MVEISSEYKGLIVVKDDDPRLSEFYSNMDINTYGLLENEYVVVLNHETGQPVDRYKWQDGKYKPVVRKQVDSNAIGKIRPKNIEQSCAMDMLLDDSITVKSMTGGFGTGKSYLACACAFNLIQQGRYDKIMWIRNNIEVKDSNSIGFLKGDFYDKMIVWAMPMADHLGGKEMLDMYVNRGQIEVEHLGFLRGRDIKNTIVFCSEAEHLTREHVQLLLGRIADGSCLILEGDCRQIDKKAFEVDNGLQAAISKLRGNRLFGYVHLSESVRSETAKLADLLNDKE